jgi:hypothetical protein
MVQVCLSGTDWPLPILQLHYVFVSLQGTQSELAFCPASGPELGEDGSQISYLLKSWSKYPSAEPLSLCLLQGVQASQVWVKNEALLCQWPGGGGVPFLVFLELCQVTQTFFEKAEMGNTD